MCEETPLTLIYTGTELSFVFTGSGSNDPRPYSSYQFQVEAQNSAGTNVSLLSGIVTTNESGAYQLSSNEYFVAALKCLFTFLSSLSSRGKPQQCRLCCGPGKSDCLPGLVSHFRAEWETAAV